MSSALFEETVKAASSRILETLKSGETTSWELKTRLQLPSSTLYLALGRLCAEKKIRLVPDQLNFKVFPEPSPDK